MGRQAPRGSIGLISTRKDPRIAVVGLGYVGLPVAVAFAEANRDVLGFDVDARKVAVLRQGRDPNGETDPARLAASGLRVNADPTDSHLHTILHLLDVFHTHVGLSGHKLSIGVPMAAPTLGATVFEKHFTVDRNDGAAEAAFSLELHDVRILVEETASAHAGLGGVRYGGSRSERAIRESGRSLYVTRNLQEGYVLSCDNVRTIRPAYSLPPREPRTAGLDTRAGR